MLRSCSWCGDEFQAKHPRAKFCGDTCRQASHRAGADAAEAHSPAGDAPGGFVEAATVAELEAAGREASPLGLAAVVLARRLDNSSNESGAAIAALARQLRDTLGAAMAGAQKAADPLDELRGRRDRKRSAG